MLSLGERMRCELAGSLLHRPEVLFLDEPTLGLDVNAQAVLRTFLRSYNERYGATVLLTSHYMGDVTALASRVVVIDGGVLRFDGRLRGARRPTTPRTAASGCPCSSPCRAPPLARYGDVVAQDGASVTLEVPRERSVDVATRVLADLDVEDLAIEDPPIEDVVRAVFDDG